MFAARIGSAVQGHSWPAFDGEMAESTRGPFDNEWFPLATFILFCYCVHTQYSTIPSTR